MQVRPRSSRTQTCVCTHTHVCKAALQGGEGMFKQLTVHVTQYAMSHAIGPQHWQSLDVFPASAGQITLTLHEFFTAHERPISPEHLYRFMCTCHKSRGIVSECFPCCIFSSICNISYVRPCSLLSLWPTEAPMLLLHQHCMCHKSKGTFLQF